MEHPDRGLLPHDATLADFMRANLLLTARFGRSAPMAAMADYGVRSGLTVTIVLVSLAAVYCIAILIR